MQTFAKRKNIAILIMFDQTKLLSVSLCLGDSFKYPNPTGILFQLSQVEGFKFLVSDFLLQFCSCLMRFFLSVFHCVIPNAVNGLTYLLCVFVCYCQLFLFGYKCYQLKWNKKISIIKKKNFSLPTSRVPMGFLTKFSQVGPAVRPAIANIYIYIHIHTYI